MMKVLLVFPRFKYPSGDPPLGLLYVAACVERDCPGCSLEFFDATFTPSYRALADKLKALRPRIVGIYCNTLMYDDSLKVARLAHAIGAIVIVGGPHATILPGTLLGKKYVDAIVKGEGERSFVSLVKRVEKGHGLDGIAGLVTSDAYEKDKGIIERTDIDVIKDLDCLPFPAYHLIDMEKYIKNWFQMDTVSSKLRGTNIVASRGCPFNCSYCQPTLRAIFGKKTRLRSPSNVLEELKILKASHGIDSFIFTDDTPTFFKSWMMEFCEKLSASGLEMTWGCNTRVGLLDKETMVRMHDAGFHRMMVGIESATQRILDDIYEKGIQVAKVLPYCQQAKEIGIKVFGYFMLGAPTEAIGEIKKTIDLAFFLPIDEATFSITTALPGTRLAGSFSSNATPRLDDFSRFDYYTSTFPASDIPSWKLRLLQRLAFIKFYLHPARWNYIVRSFTTMEAIKKSLLKLKRIAFT